MDVVVLGNPEEEIFSAARAGEPGKNRGRGKMIRIIQEMKMMSSILSSCAEEGLKDLIVCTVVLVI